MLTTTTAWGEDRFRLTLGAHEYWDSNFARNATVDSEHYTRSVVALAVNEHISKQHFSFGVTGNRYDYEQRDDLDVSFYEGNASWRSDWNQRAKSSLAWTRDAYAVDRLEFAGKDVVAVDNLTGQFTLGTGNNVGVTLGASKVAQAHSNDARELLDFDENEFFVEGTYTSATHSLLSLRLRQGKRGYVNTARDNPSPLDFDYDQLELGGVWVLTQKTQVEFTLGRFKREGIINTGTGTQASLDIGWAISEKLKLALSYSQSEPALGETSDSPADIRASKLMLTWVPAHKWLVGISAGYSEQGYLPQLTEPAREENIITISPFTLTYHFSSLASIHLDSQWVDRQSPLLYRDYHYLQANLGITLVF